MVNSPLGTVFSQEKFVELKQKGILINPESFEDYEKDVKNNRSSKPEPSYWSGKRVLITGAAGMVGSTMIDMLIEMGAELYGTVRRHAVAVHPNIEHQIDSGKLKPVEIDLKDYGHVASTVKKIDPHVISHQAAESFVPSSIQQPSHVVENNCVTTVNILEAATKEAKSLEAIQVACSSEQYGFVQDLSELPVREENDLRPTSTYAATKVFTEYLAKSYHYMYKTPTVITRTFNQEGPRRGPQFFTARIAHQIRRLLDGKADKIIMGNPNAVRDFTHVYDSVAAQLLAIEKCNKGEAYNICSGKGITTGDYARLALQLFNLKNEILVNKDLLRPYERGEALFDGFVGSNKKINEQTGWKPTRSVLDIIRDGVGK